MPLERRKVQGRRSNARHGAERFRWTNQVPPVTAPVTKKPTIRDILNSAILLPSSAMNTDSVVMTAVITSPMARFLRTSEFSNFSSFLDGRAAVSSFTRRHAGAVIGSGRPRPVHLLYQPPKPAVAAARVWSRTTAMDGPASSTTSPMCILAGGCSMKTQSRAKGSPAPDASTPNRDRCRAAA